MLFTTCGEKNFALDVLKSVGINSPSTHCLLGFVGFVVGWKLSLSSWLFIGNQCQVSVPVIRVQGYRKIG